MTNNALILVLLWASAAAWILYLERGRSSPWGFCLWLPLTATATIGTIIFIALLPEVFASELGDAFGGDKAVLAGPSFRRVLLAPVVLVIGLLIRPRPAADSAKVVTCSVLAFLAVGAVVWAAPIDRIPLRLHLVTVDGQPVAGAKVKYETRCIEDPFYSPEIHGEPISDREGRVVLYTRREHGLFASIEKENISSTDIHVGSGGSWAYRQVEIHWSGAQATDDYTYPDRQWAHFDLPEGREISLEVYLPRKGIDTVLLYPAEKPRGQPK